MSPDCLAIIVLTHFCSGKIGLSEDEDPVPARVPAAVFQQAANEVDDADLDDLDGSERDNEDEADGA